MENKDIIKKNKIVAKFMNLDPENSWYCSNTGQICERSKLNLERFGKYPCLNDIRYEGKINCDYECDCDIDNKGKFLFHCSWDWLMPVIGKISNQCEEPEELDDLKYSLLTNNIEEAYIFVTSYIESYNSLDINKVLNDGKD